MEGIDERLRGGVLQVEGGGSLVVAVWVAGVAPWCGSACSPDSPVL